MILKKKRFDNHGIHVWHTFKRLEFFKKPMIDCCEEATITGSTCADIFMIEWADAYDEDDKVEVWDESGFAVDDKVGARNSEAEGWICSMSWIVCLTG